MPLYKLLEGKMVRNEGGVRRVYRSATRVSPGADVIDMTEEQAAASHARLQRVGVLDAPAPVLVAPPPVDPTPDHDRTYAAHPVDPVDPTPVDPVAPPAAAPASITTLAVPAALALISATETRAELLTYRADEMAAKRRSRVIEAITARLRDVSE